MGMGIKGISSAFHLSRNTVRKYQESGLTTEQMLSMSEDKLQDLFLDGKNRSRVPSSRRTELDALVPDYVKRQRRTHMFFLKSSMEPQMRPCVES